MWTLLSILASLLKLTFMIRKNPWFGLMVKMNQSIHTCLLCHLHWKKANKTYISQWLICLNTVSHASIFLIISWEAPIPSKRQQNRTTNTITKCSLSWRMLIYRGTQCADKVNRRRCKMHHNTYIYMFLATMMIWWLRHHGTTVRWCNLYDLTMKSLPS